MGLFEDLRNLSEQIKKRQAHVRGEEATKQALVLPFLQVLGFDIYDPAEVNPEYAADFSRKKSGGPREKIDYCINLDGAPAIFLECKSFNTKLENHGSQLARYFNSTPSVKLAIITNGAIYRFFTDLHEKNIMDDKPFFEFRIHGFSENDVKLLKRFTKEFFKGSLVAQHAGYILLLRKATQLLSKQIKAPTENLMRFIVGEAEPAEQVRLPSDRERFASIVRNSISQALEELAGITITVPELSPVSPRVESVAVQPVPSAYTHEEADGIGEKDAAILDERLNPKATNFELEVLNAIIRICADSPLKIPIKHSVRRIGLAIHLGTARSWFVRLFSRDRRNQFTFQLAPAQIESMASEFETGPCPDDLGQSRVFFSSVADVEKLRALILRAYEDAVRGQVVRRVEEDDSAD